MTETSRGLEGSPPPPGAGDVGYRQYFKMELAVKTDFRLCCVAAQRRGFFIKRNRKTVNRSEVDFEKLKHHVSQEDEQSDILLRSGHISFLDVIT